MYNVIDINEGINLNTSIFMNNVCKKFDILLNASNQTKIYLDIRKAKFVSPLVLPKICCLGLYAAKNGKELELIIDPNSRIKDYLSQANFFDIVNKYNILTVDEGLTGGTINKNNLTYAFLCFRKDELISKYERMYEFSNNISEKEKLKFCVQMEVMGENYQYSIFDENTIRRSQILSVLKEFSNDYETIEEIASGYVELIHNSLWHGNTICFFALQAATYKTKNLDKFIQIDVSIMDAGKGLYDSFFNKNWIEEKKITKTIELDKFLSLKSENAKNFYSMLEMILYRRDEGVRGIYDVMLPLIYKKEMRILLINKNMQMTLNSKNLKKVLEGETQLKSCIDWKEKNTGIGFGMDISFKI